MIGMTVSVKPILYTARVIFFCSGLSIALSVFASEQPKVEIEDPVLIHIGEKERVRASEVVAYAKKRTDLRALLGTATGTSMLMEEIAMTRVLVLEGERLNESKGEQSDDPRFDDLYALKTYTRIAKQCAMPESQEASKAYYESTPEAFMVPPQARLLRIVFPDTLTVDKFPAEEWMGLQANAVATGSTSFERLVNRAQYIAPNLKQGDMGWLLLEGDQSLVKALRGTTEGEMIGPIKEGGYVYLLQVVAKRDAKKLDWEEVKVQVPKRAVQYCRQSERERIRAELFGRYQITFDKTQLKALAP